MGKEKKTKITVLLFYGSQFDLIISAENCEAFLRPYFPDCIIDVHPLPSSGTTDRYAVSAITPRGKPDNKLAAKAAQVMRKLIE